MKYGQLSSVIKERHPSVYLCAAGGQGQVPGSSSSHRYLSYQVSVRVSVFLTPLGQEHHKSKDVSVQGFVNISLCGHVSVCTCVPVCTRTEGTSRCVIGHVWENRMKVSLMSTRFTGRAKIKQWKTCSSAEKKLYSHNTA